MFDGPADRPAADPPPFVQRLDPPAPCWVETRRVFPAGPAEGYRRTPSGFVTTYDVPGLVHHWVPTSTGGRLGWVTFASTTEDQQWQRTVSMYVPAHMLKRRSPGRRQPRFEL